MSDGEQLQKALSRKKNSNKPINNLQKRVKDKGKGKEKKVEDEELQCSNEDARRPIENGGGGSISVSDSATQKRKSDVRGGQKTKHKKQKQEEQSREREERKDLEVKEKQKPKEKKKLKGKEAGEREVAEKKKKKKEEGEDEEEDEGGADCRFPMRRVDRIIRSVGSDYRITHEAVFLINKATEKFLEVFGEDSYKLATQDRKNYVSYKNLSSVVSKDKSFYFLSDYVPEKVTAEKALAETQAVE